MGLQSHGRCDLQWFKVRGEWRRNGASCARCPEWGRDSSRLPGLLLRQSRCGFGCRPVLGWRDGPNPSSRLRRTSVCRFPRCGSHLPDRVRRLTRHRGIDVAEYAEARIVQSFLCYPPEERAVVICPTEQSAWGRCYGEEITGVTQKTPLLATLARSGVPGSVWWTGTTSFDTISNSRDHASGNRLDSGRS